MTELSPTAAQVMLSDTEDMSTYNYCGGGMVTHTLYMVLLGAPPPQTTWTISSNKMALITSGCGTMRSPGIKQPVSPRGSVRVSRAAGGHADLLHSRRRVAGSPLMPRVLPFC